MDESGDLGWSLDAPYRRGGSSRFLTLGAVLCEPGTPKHPKRLIIKQKRRNQWDKNSERKWSQLSVTQKSRFAHDAANLTFRQAGVRYIGMTVRKVNVHDNLR